MLIGNKVQILSVCDSTNDFLKQQIGGWLENGTVVCAKSQPNGRGQRGNVWESEAGKNLTFSFYVEPISIAIQEQFSLNYFISLAIFDFLSNYIDATTIKLKWPNDIYVKDNKIAGVLIENQVKNGLLSNSIVGIGLNINQMYFKNTRATSLGIETKENYEVEEGLGVLLHYLNKRYQDFCIKDLVIMKEMYLSKLLGMGEKRRFFDNIQAKIILGQITGVNSVGALQLLVDNEIRSYGIKEISFLFEGHTV